MYDLKLKIIKDNECPMNNNKYVYYDLLLK